MVFFLSGERGLSERWSAGSGEALDKSVGSGVYPLIDFSVVGGLVIYEWGAESSSYTPGMGGELFSSTGDATGEDRAGH